MKPTYRKYVVFFGVVLVGLFLDQWSKQYASSRLATHRPGYVDHPVVLDVGDDDDGETLAEFLSGEFTSNEAAELDTIAQYHARLDGGDALRPDSTLEAGQRIEITNRKVVVVKDYWDFQYTENPGAAFGLLADGHEDWRVPFFILISLVAVGMILYILRGVKWRQQLLVWGLSFIAAGAVGNFIDRIRFGYVVDFIVWKYTDQYRWPTFNVADSLICIGVGLMAIELIGDAFRQPDQDDQPKLDAPDNPATPETATET